MLPDHGLECGASPRAELAEEGGPLGFADVETITRLLVFGALYVISAGVWSLTQPQARLDIALFLIGVGLGIGWLGTLAAKRR